MIRALPGLLVLAACGGDDVAPAVDAGPILPDAATVTGYVPDPITMGEQLPAAIPVLRVDVGGATIQRDVEVPGTLSIDAGAAIPIGFQGRGNFTWSLPKKGYAFELQDGAGNDAARAILGLPAGSDFALYACYTDKTCLRDALVFAIGQSLGRWSPRTRFVELYLDGAYQGLYMVWERIRRDHDRVAIAKDGGFIVRHEGGAQGDGSDFQTTNGVYYQFHYPSPESITPAAQDVVRAAWQAMEDAVVADPGTALIDRASWVDRAIVEEVTNNWDGYVHSIYMTMDEGVIGMGPLWDFDLAFGNGNVTGYNCRTDVWAYQIVRGAPDDVPDYWLAAWADPGFQTAWKCRYQQLRGDALSDETFAARIATWVDHTADARARDQARWPTIGAAVFPNCTTEPTYAADVAWLEQWIFARLAWLDDQAAAMPGACGAAMFGR